VKFPQNATAGAAAARLVTLPGLNASQACSTRNGVSTWSTSYPARRTGRQATFGLTARASWTSGRWGTSRGKPLTGTDEGSRCLEVVAGGRSRPVAWCPPGNGADRTWREDPTAPERFRPGVEQVEDQTSVQGHPAEGPWPTVVVVWSGKCERSATPRLATS